MFKNPTIFALLYSFLMIPTYVLPYFGSNSLLLVVFTGTIPFLLHFGASALLVWIAWRRGIAMGLNWLPILPLIALVFDFVPGLSAIPFIPTTMHVLTLGLGVVLSNQFPPLKKGD